MDAGQQEIAKALLPYLNTASLGGTVEYLNNLGIWVVANNVDTLLLQMIRDPLATGFRVNGAGNKTLTLLGVNPGSRVETIKQIRCILHNSLKDARDMVDSAGPGKIILSTCNEEVLQYAARCLDKAQAIYVIASV